MVAVYFSLIQYSDILSEISIVFRVPYHFCRPSDAQSNSQQIGAEAANRIYLVDGLIPGASQIAEDFGFLDRWSAPGLPPSYQVVMNNGAQKGWPHGATLLVHRKAVRQVFFVAQEPTGYAIVKVDELVLKRSQICQFCQARKMELQCRVVRLHFILIVLHCDHDNVCQFTIYSYSYRSCWQSASSGRGQHAEAWWFGWTRWRKCILWAVCQMTCAGSLSSGMMSTSTQPGCIISWLGMLQATTTRWSLLMLLEGKLLPFSWILMNSLHLLQESFKADTRVKQA